MNGPVVFLVGVILGLILVSLFKLRQTKGGSFFAACEYWVFLPGDQMPTQDDLMTQMVARNPYAQGGQTPIGSREGALFSDIRVSSTLVLRSKNPHVFRPDIFAEVEMSPDKLTALASAQSIVKLRFLSEEPLIDDRHLQFMPHMAGAYTRLGKATAVFDVVAERLFTAAEFDAQLAQDIDAKRAEFHIRIAWTKEDGSAKAETKGLVKKGLPELVTADARTDNQRLICEVLEEAASLAWQRGEILDTEIVEYFGDRFEVRIMPSKDRKRLVHIVRYQAI